jgi:large subunit ribosomal protein MRP49
MLPRLKYHNPAIPMTVSRQPNPEINLPAFINVYINKTIHPEDGPAPAKPTSTPEQPSTSTPYTPLSTDVLKSPTPAYSTTTPFPPPAEPDERIMRIDMLNRDESAIWEEFASQTNARKLEPTPGELQTMKELQVLKERDRLASEEGKKIRDEFKRQEEFLRKARDENADAAAAAA